eukprot:1157343-Pelagomonas_calceolata.AAC.9
MAASTSPPAPDVFAQLLAAADFPALCPPSASQMTWQLAPTAPPAPKPTAASSSTHTSPSAVFAKMLAMPALSPSAEPVVASDVVWRSTAPRPPPASANSPPASAIFAQVLGGSDPLPALRPPVSSDPTKAPH